MKLLKLKAQICFTLLTKITLAFDPKTKFLPMWVKSLLFSFPSSEHKKYLFSVWYLKTFLILGFIFCYFPLGFLSSDTLTHWPPRHHTAHRHTGHTGEGHSQHPRAYYYRGHVCSTSVQCLPPTVVFSRQRSRWWCCSSKMFSFTSSSRLMPASCAASRASAARFLATNAAPLVAFAIWIRASRAFCNRKY